MYHIAEWYGEPYYDLSDARRQQLAGFKASGKMLQKDEMKRILKYRDKAANGTITSKETTSLQKLEARLAGGLAGGKGGFGAMLRALARGVRISLLTGNAVARRADGTFFPGPIYRELFDHMVKQRLEPLIRRGARVYEYVAPEHPMVVAAGAEVRPYVHAKVLTCDARAASIGGCFITSTRLNNARAIGASAYAEVSAHAQVIRDKKTRRSSSDDG